MHITLLSGNSIAVSRLGCAPWLLAYGIIWLASSLLYLERGTISLREYSDSKPCLRHGGSLSYRKLRHYTTGSTKRVTWSITTFHTRTSSLALLSMELSLKSRRMLSLQPKS